MDEIKESPNPLGWLSGLLRRSSNAIKPFEPGALPLISDTGSSLAKGIDHWGYGDKPWDSRANTPLWDSEKSLDMLTSLPVGAAGKALGATGPAAQAALVGLSPESELGKRLMQLLRSGVPKEDAWQRLGAAVVPTHTNQIPLDFTMQDHSFPMVREVSDSLLRAKPSALMSLPEKMAVIKNLAPLEKFGAQKRAERTDLFKPGKYKMGDLIEHPELFKANPDAAARTVIIDPAVQGFGVYNPNTRTIGLNTENFLRGDKPGGQLGSLMHENTHDMQNMFGMPQGSNMTANTISPAEQNTLRDIYNTFKDDPNESALDIWNLRNIVKAMDNPTHLYLDGLGEQQARMVQTRLKMSPAMREQTHPDLNYDNLAGGVDPAFIQKVLRSIRVP